MRLHGIGDAGGYIQSGFVSLGMLKCSGDSVQLPILFESGTGLMIIEGYPVFRTLLMDLFHPCIITDPGIRS